MFPYDVYALAVSGTNLYVGGSFSAAGTVRANCVAKWNGSTWSALGSGTSLMNNGVEALVVSGTNLYAGGDFTTAGGITANFIARWDGSAWSALGSGMDRPILALAVSGSTLYAGGYFTTAGGVTANYTAAWNGSTWSGMGSGVDDYVYALASDGSGHLFVGGDFYFAGTNLSPFIAQANIGPTPGWFGRLVYSPATGFSCMFSNAAIGQTYRIQTSPSLAGGSWTDFTNFTYTGPMVIGDPPAAAGPKKFYRAVSP